jgi:glycosyltransferase involved in cell wall biosynthesis
MVSVPSFDRSLKSKCAESIGNAIENANAEGVLDEAVHVYVGGYDVARARNFMAQYALEKAVDYLFMVDSDIVLPVDALTSLLENKVDVCLGYYARGTDDSMTNIVKAGSTDYRNCYSIAEMVALKDAGVGLIKAKGGGMGCALIRTDVFKRSVRPWFKYLDYANGDGLSEDYYFCNTCNGAGFGVYVDARVACGHIHDKVMEAR